MLRFGRSKQDALRRQARLLWKRHDTIVKYFSVTHVERPPFHFSKLELTILRSGQQVNCRSIALRCHSLCGTTRKPSVKFRRQLHGPHNLAECLWTSSLIFVSALNKSSDFQPFEGY